MAIPHLVAVEFPGFTPEDIASVDAAGFADALQRYGPALDVVILPADPLLVASVRQQQPDLEILVWMEGVGRSTPALEAGANAVIRLPCEPRELRAHVDAALDRRWLRATRMHDEALRAVLATVEPERLPEAITNAWCRALAADCGALFVGSSPTPAWTWGADAPGTVPPADESTLVVPLEGPRRLGTLVARRRWRPFSRREIHAVSTFAGAARSALENAQLQQQVQQSARLEVLGRLAAGLAHELRVPLTYLLDNTTFLKDAMEHVAIDAAHGTREHLQEAADDAVFGAKRLQELIRDIDALARNDATTRTAVEVAGVVDAALRMTAQEVRGRARTAVRIEPGLRVIGSPGRLTQVLVNLIANAAQAVRAGEGSISITARADGSRVLIDVSDNGPGIPPEQLPRLFELFYTTKEAGKGSGLGLYICEDIVRKHGGFLRVRSTPGRGATFTVELPALQTNTDALDRRDEVC